MSIDNPEFSLRAVIAYISIVLSFIVITIVLYWPIPELAFLSDNSPLSWLSSAQLWALALLAMRLTTERALPIVLGVWLSLAMLYLAFDEQFLLHEHWKHGCSNWFNLCQFRIVTEIPILLVGIVGVYTAYRLHLILFNQSARWMLWAAISIGGLAIALDLFAYPKSILFLEEGFEVVAEALFIGVLLGWRKPSRESDVAILSD